MVKGYYSWFSFCWNSKIQMK